MPSWKPTRFGKTVIGLVSGAIIGAVALSVFGGIDLRGTVNYVTVTGTSTGAKVAVDGFVHDWIIEKGLTMTGGNVKVGTAGAGGLKYNAGLICNELTTTGAILAYHVDWIRAPKVGEWTVSIISSTDPPNAGTGTLVHANLRRTSSTGAYVIYSTGSTLFGPTQCVKLSLIVAPTTSGSGYLTIRMRDIRAK